MGGHHHKATGPTIETARERLQVVSASIASVDPAVLAAELKATLDEYIGALRSLHAGVTGGCIVKDPGAGGDDSVPVEVPAEVLCGLAD